MKQRKYTEAALSRMQAGVGSGEADWKQVSAVKNLISGFPMHRESRENDNKNSLSGKTQGI